MLEHLLAFLGLSNGASALNKTLAAVNYLAIAPFAIWLWAHRDEQITFTTSLGFLCLIAAAVLALLELERRAPYRPRDSNDRQDPTTR